LQYGYVMRLIDEFLVTLTGRFVNWLSWPGFVQECDYESRIDDTRVAVTIGPLYTIVNVNGVDVFFHRLTGNIAGVGLMPASESKLEQKAVES
jgi:hypothetical protein